MSLACHADGGSIRALCCNECSKPVKRFVIFTQLLLMRCIVLGTHNHRE
jgi:hypothetical protein